MEYGIYTTTSHGKRLKLAHVVAPTYQQANAMARSIGGHAILESDDQYDYCTRCHAVTASVDGNMPISMPVCDCDTPA